MDNHVNFTGISFSGNLKAGAYSTNLAAAGKFISLER